jgi:hypothetical protein
MVGFFINSFISKRRNAQHELKKAYADIIASARSIRRTLIVFHEFNISFTNMILTIKDGDAINMTELDIQKQAAFNYEAMANKYRDILTEQQGQLDQAFFTLTGTEKGYLVKRWQNKSKDKNDKSLQSAVEKILSYKEDPKSIDDAKDTVDTYFKSPLQTIQKICSDRMQKL